MHAYRSVPVIQEKSSTETGKSKQSCVGRLLGAKKNISKSKRALSITHRKPWTEDEQELFEQGLKLYGRSWTKIANMIDTRTTLQVKNFAKQYFKQKNKNLTKCQEQVSQGIDIQCDDSFVLANVEEVTHENVLPEDEYTTQTTAVTLDSAKENIESDEDVEVDIDGSDEEEQCNLIPGQTTSCPKDVYSALVRAAATGENLSEPTREKEGEFTHAEGNPRDVPTDVTSVNSLHLEEAASAAISNNTPPVKQADVEQTPWPSYASSGANPCGERKPGDEGESIIGDANSCDTIDKVINVNDDCMDVTSFGLPFCGSKNENSRGVHVHTVNASSFLTKASLVSPNTCRSSSAETFVREPADMSNITLEPGDSDVERNWTPVTCGEVTCSESIEPSDRKQPGAISDNNQRTLYKAIVIDSNTIQDVEKEYNVEFFMGRALKTPERYMKIRNHILGMWEKTKPCYLFKTAVRSGLRNCGDVNSIGRVHAFLEDIGAVNVGCIDRPAPRVTRQQGEVSDVKEIVQLESWVNSLRPRRKRPRTNDGAWFDFSKPEGMTIQHLDPDERAAQDGALNDKGSPSTSRKRSSRSRPSYDPFLLVPCRKFPSPSAMPYDVLIQSETLVVMDTHAHMSTTEVIGLLGGHYCHGTRLLRVSMAIPCRSLSTGLQCEMDPVSQTQASEDLAHRGLSVVGWYHSHPTFLSIPSIRDIETQAKFQEWFGKGGAPFIGIIVSPYNYSNPSNQSQIRCLTVGDEWDSAGQYRIPYQFDYEVYEDEADEHDTLEQIRSIADDYRTYPFRVQLNRQFESSTDLNLLDKLLDSLRSRVGLSGDDKREAFLNRIKKTISETIKPYQPNQATETLTEGPPEHQQDAHCAK